MSKDEPLIDEENADDEAEPVLAFLEATTQLLGAMLDQLAENDPATRRRYREIWHAGAAVTMRITFDVHGRHRIELAVNAGGADEGVIFKLESQEPGQIRRQQ